MADIIFRDAYGNEKYRKATGTGTAADPVIPVTTFESDVIINGVVTVNGGLEQTDDIKVTMDGEPLEDTAAGDLAAINVSTATLATNIPDTAAGDLATINTSTATIAGAVSTEMQCDIVAELPAGTQNIGDVDVASLPSGNLGQQASAASLSVTPATDVADATYIGDVNFGESLPAGTNNIGDVDVATLPSGNLGQQAMAASLSTVPANNITDGTYIGDINFGESIPAGSAIIGQVGIDQTTDGTTNKVQARNATHDNLQCNANLQVADADVSASNPVPVVGLGASSIGEYNVTLTLVDTEYSQALPSNCKGVEIWSRGGYEIRFAFTTGKVATPTAPYFTLKSDESYSSPPGLNLSSKTIYFGTDTAGDVIELITWS